MTDALMKLYSRLPPSGRSAAASLRGAYLRSWRYGRQTEALIEAALDREKWSPKRWKSYRKNASHSCCTARRHRCPTIATNGRRAGGSGIARRGTASRTGRFCRKKFLRSNPHAFIADDCNTRRMFRERTSGTTGKPLELWRRAETVETLYAISELRERRWHGVSVKRPLGDAWRAARCADREPPSAVLGVEQSAESVVHVHVPPGAAVHLALSRRARHVPASSTCGAIPRRCTCWRAKRCGKAGVHGR